MTISRKNGEQYADPTAYEALTNIEKAENKVVHRGEIYYIESGNTTQTGSENRSDRPAIIISNDTNNKYSNTVCIIYLTTADKKPMPTHVTVKARETSTALCEQIFAVDKSRIKEFIRTLSYDEMQRIDAALMVSLALDRRNATEQPQEPFFKYGQINPAVIIEPPPIDTEKIRTETERDLYKQLYENLLAKMCG